MPIVRMTIASKLRISFVRKLLRENAAKSTHQINLLTLLRRKKKRKTRKKKKKKKKKKKERKRKRKIEEEEEEEEEEQEEKRRSYPKASIHGPFKWIRYNREQIIPLSHRNL